MRLVISVREISIRLMNFMYATSRLTERADFPEHTENDAILGAEWRPDAETRPYPENSDFSAYFTQKHILMYARARARQKNFPSCGDPFPAVFVEMPTKEQHYASGLFFL